LLITLSKSYNIEFNHGGFIWSVEKTFKEIKEVHRILAKTIKADLGKSLTDIHRKEYKLEWPLFPLEHEYLIHESGAKERSVSSFEINSYSKLPFG
jgi:hypothetical protein